MSRLKKQCDVNHKGYIRLGIRIRYSDLGWYTNRNFHMISETSEIISEATVESPTKRMLDMFPLDCVLLREVYAFCRALGLT